MVVKSKDNSIITLHEKVAILSANEIRLQARIELVESANGIIDGSAEEVNKSHVSTVTEKLNEIQLLKSKVEEKEQVIRDKERVISDINRELVKKSDMLTEKEDYIRNVDNMYAEIINRKDGSMATLLQIMEADDEMTKKFKRMLVKVLAEKEFNNIKEMYMNISHKNVSTQVDERKTRNKADDGSGNNRKGDFKKCQSCSVSNAEDTNVGVTQGVSRNDSVSDKDDKENMVAIRAVNLPPEKPTYIDYSV